MAIMLPAPGHRGHHILAARNRVFPAMAVTASVGMLITGTVAVLEAVAAAASWHWIAGISLIATPLLTYAGLTLASIIDHLGCQTAANNDPHHP